MTLCSKKNNILLSEMLDFLSCKNYPSLTLLRTKKQSNKKCNNIHLYKFLSLFLGISNNKITIFND